MYVGITSVGKMIICEKKEELAHVKDIVKTISISYPNLLNRVCAKTSMGDFILTKASNAKYYKLQVTDIGINKTRLAKMLYLENKTNPQKSE